MDALVHPCCAEILIQSFLWARDRKWFRILGFVVMPNHYHLGLGLRSEKSLSEAISSIDKYSARNINQALGRTGPLWEEGFYEHAIRDRRDFDDILAYMHGNPVQGGLCETVDQWPHSTVNPDYAAEIDWEWLGHSFP
jgi:REP element-mobilizing transposase RayT